MPTQWIYAVCAARGAPLARHLALLIALLIQVVPQPVRAQPDETKTRGERWALLIGVDDYAVFNDLTYCGADMRALREKLLASGFKQDHVFLLDDQARDPQGQNDNAFRPFKANIEREISQVLRLVKKGDVLILGLSGHGTHINGSGYFCPGEASLDDYEQTMIALPWIYGQLETCAASLKLLLIDACRNDPRPGSQKGSSFDEQFQGKLDRAPKGVLWLSSCSNKQTSFEEPDFKHGVFMHFLLRGFDGAADREVEGNRDGRISLLELFQYASRSTELHVHNKYHKEQTPTFSGEITREVFDFSIIPGRPAPDGPLTNSLGMRLAPIAPGRFEMGTNESTAQLQDAFGIASADRRTAAFNYDDERPPHQVRITKPFYLGAHEVTVGQFTRFVDATGYRTDAEQDGRGGWGYDTRTKEFAQKPQYTWRDSGAEQNDNSPVVNVGWNDATAFCDWLSKQEGHRYRLPTEAEWEYACRAGTATRYYSGNQANALAEIANVADATAQNRFRRTNAAGADVTWRYAITVSDGWAFTAPIGSYRPNAFGLYDMHGNVSEWCSDRYGVNYYAQSPESDPPGPTSGAERVFRGGGWYNSAAGCRAARRSKGTPETRDRSLGFRVAFEP